MIRIKVPVWVPGSDHLVSWGWGQAIGGWGRCRVPAHTGQPLRLPVRAQTAARQLWPWAQRHQTWAWLPWVTDWGVRGRLRAASHSSSSGRKRLPVQYSNKLWRIRPLLSFSLVPPLPPLKGEVAHRARGVRRGTQNTILNAPRRIHTIPRCPLWGWCSAQRIKIVMIAGGNHTSVSCRVSGKGGVVGNFELLPFIEQHPLSQAVRPASSPIGEPRV